MQIIEPAWAWNGMPTKRSSTTQIIGHHSASDPSTTAATIDSWHKAKGWMGIGYHYVIHEDGAIVRGRPEWAIGAHAVPVNGSSIAICLAGDFRYYSPTDAQIKSFVWLVKDIRSRYGDIPLAGHNEVDSTICPGPLFPWDRIFTLLKEDDTVTYAEFKTFMAQYESEKAVEAASDWSDDARQWALDTELIVGDGKGNYNWKSNPSREQIAQILYVALKER